MKPAKFIICLALFFLTNAFVYSQCPPSLGFTKQSDVDAFLNDYPNCTEIVGDVTIKTGDSSGDVITNLNGLINITTIGGELWIDGVQSGGISSLQTLNGLYNLNSVGEGIFIDGVSSLISLDGLQNLSNVGESLVCQNVPIGSLLPLSNLSSIASITIRETDISNFKGLENISNLAGGLWIELNENISSFEGLQNITSIGGALFISDIPTAANIDYLDNLQNIGGNFRIQLSTIQDFTWIENLSSVGSGFAIAWTGFDNFNGLENLETIGGNMEITGGDAQDFDGLDNLEMINGDLSLKWSSIKSFEGLDQLASIGGSLKIEKSSLGQLDLGDAPILTSIGGNFEIVDNSQIIEILAATNQISIGGNLIIKDNTSLSSCAANYICDYFSNPSGTITVQNNGGWACDNASDIAYECSYSIVRGTVYADLDCDGIFNGGDSYIPNIFIENVSTNTPIAFPSNQDGTFEGYLIPNSSHTFTSTFPPNFSDVHPASHSITTGASMQTYTGYDFRLCPISSFKNLEVTYTLITPPRPGFMNQYEICVRNLGTEVTDAELGFYVEAFLDGTATPTNTDGGTFSGANILWSIPGMIPFQEVCKTVTIEVDAGAMIGAEFFTQANVEPAEGFQVDIDLSNNQVDRYQTIIGAYDPNDKLVEDSLIDYSTVSGSIELEYLIRFQNTGTFYAETVRVIDTLENRLDVSTLKMIAASHSYTLSIRDGNILTWTFADIFLPHEAADELGSHGYISFKISTTSNLELSDVIGNRVGIYFDFNEPIITNTATTSFYIANCHGGEVFANGNETQVFTCPQDGNADLVTFSNNSSSTLNYAYLITDENDVIIAVENAQFDFDNASVGVCLVYGVSYEGNLIANIGADINTVSSSIGCVELSENYIEIIRDIPEGGSVFTLGGETEIDLCVGNGNEDIVYFDYTTFSASDYVLLVTDAAGNLIEIPADLEVDFENNAPGTCLVSGVSFTGNLIIQPGQNIFTNPISDDCYELSSNQVQVNRVNSDTDAGFVSTSTGADFVVTCTLDGVPDIIDFENTGTSGANYNYIITDENEEILTIVDSFFDFEGISPGLCFVFGVSYEGTLDASPGATLLSVTSSEGCAQISSNFIEVVKDFTDGGDVLTEDGLNEITFCVDNSAQYNLTFDYITTSQADYILTLTNENNEIVSLHNDVEISFSGLPAGIYFVGGISYTGNLIAVPGTNVFDDALSDECYSISNTAVQINIASNNVDGGTVMTSDSLNMVTLCVGDGNDDFISFTNQTNSPFAYAYVLTDDQGNIIDLPVDTILNFENSAPGVCLIEGISYNGDFIAQLGDNVLNDPLATGCYEVSNTNILINKVMNTTDGGNVTTTIGLDTVSVCVGDGNADIVQFSNSSTSNDDYQYIITDEDGDISALLFGDQYDFETTPTGYCHVYGLSYTGTLLASSGDNIFSDTLSDACFQLSHNAQVIYKVADETDGGQVMTSDGLDSLSVCVDDGIDDLIVFDNNSISNSHYGYVITDTDGNILEFPANNEYNFENSSLDTCFVYGVSYTGNWMADINLSVFDNQFSDGCYELSENWIIINRVDSGPLCVTSTEELELEGFGVRMFPNPARKFVQISVTTTISIQEDLSVKIFNSVGEIVWKEAYHRYQLSDNIDIRVEDFPNGVYFILVEQGNLGVFEKILKF